MKTIYAIIIFLSCFVLNVKAATPNIESTTLELTYKAGGGFIKSVELGGGSVSYALRIYTTTEVNHVRVDWRDYGGTIIYTSIYTPGSGDRFIDIPSLRAYSFTVSLDYTNLVHFDDRTDDNQQVIYYLSETRYYTIKFS